MGQDHRPDVLEGPAHRGELGQEVRPVPGHPGVDDRDEARLLDEVGVDEAGAEAMDAVRDLHRRILTAGADRGSCGGHENARRNRRSLDAPVNTSTDRLTRCSRPLRARPTIRCRRAACLAHLSTRFVAAALQSPGLSTAFARSSRRAGRATAITAPVPLAGPTARASAEQLGTGDRSRPTASEGRTEPAQVARAADAAGGCRAQRNARRNLGSVASNACASTCAVTFDLVAPSGKTYSTVPRRGLPSPLVHDFRGSEAEFREGCPRSIHEASREFVWTVTVLELQRPGGCRRPRTGSPSASTATASIASRCRLQAQVETDPQPAPRPRPPSRRCGDADRRALDEDDRRRVPRLPQVVDAIGGHAIAVERPVALGVEREQPGRGRELEVAEPSVGIELQQKGRADPLPRRDDLSPASAASTLGDGPGDGGAVGRRGHVRPGAASRSSDQRDGVAAAGASWTPLPASPPRVACQRLGDGGQLAGQRRCRSAAAPGRPARRTRARPSHAPGSGRAARRRRTGCGRRRRPRARRGGPRSRPGACQGRSPSARTRARSPATAGRRRRLVARPGLDQVGLVEGHEPWLVARPELVEDGLDGRPVLAEVRIGRVHHLDEDVGPVDLLERRPERVDELVRQLVDEADGVGDDRGLAVAELDLARGRVERREELVLGPGDLAPTSVFSSVDLPAFV